MHGHLIHDEASANARRKLMNALMFMEMKMPGVLIAETSVDILLTTVHVVLVCSLVSI